MTLHKLLYATIATWEISERLRREDFSFDAWEFFAERIGYKHPSVLRKMCQPRGDGNNAKLGIEEALVIMNVTGDYRMLQFLISELAFTAPPEHLEAVSKLLLTAHVSVEQRLKAAEGAE